MKGQRQDQPVTAVVTLGHGDAANQHDSDAVEQHRINDEDRQVLIPIDKSWRGQTGNTGSCGPRVTETQLSTRVSWSRGVFVDISCVVCLPTPRAGLDEDLIGRRSELPLESA